MSLRRKRKCTALLKPKGKSGGNVGTLLQQSCLPGSRHRHPLLLYETQLKHSFSAEILLFSIPAEAVPLSANAIALAALPKGSPPPRWPPTTSGEASAVVLSPPEIWDTVGTAVGTAMLQVRPTLRTPPRNLSCFVPGRPNPKSCKNHHASGADEVLPNAKQLINSRTVCQKPSLLAAVAAEIPHFTFHHLSKDMNK